MQSQQQLQPTSAGCEFVEMGAWELGIWFWTAFFGLGRLAESLRVWDDFLGNKESRRVFSGHVPSTSANVKSDHDSHVPFPCLALYNPNH